METANSTPIAIKNRIATNEIGGKSRNPILITSHVELQTTQSVSHATGTPHPTLGRQLCFDRVFGVFIYSAESGRTVVAASAAANRLFVYTPDACVFLHKACDTRAASEPNSAAV